MWSHSAPDGTPVVGEPGELVVRKPMPSMPVGLGKMRTARDYEAYFADYPGLWRHGDWLTVTERDTYVITGRSDATLNRGGVRLGTGEFYAVLEQFPGVKDGLVVHLDGDADRPMGQLLLFVVLDGDASLGDALYATIRAALRQELSPRHVPDHIVEVAAIPYTLTGMKLEVPVKRILQGAEPQSDGCLERDAGGAGGARRLRQVVPITTVGRTVAMTGQRGRPPMCRYSSQCTLPQSPARPAA